MRDIKPCEYYNELRKSGMLENGSNCKDGCICYHRIIYLESLYENNVIIEKETLFKFMEDEQSRVRYLSVLLFIRYYNMEEIPRKLYYDPYYKIRVQFIRLLDTNTLLEFIADENEEVKCKVLEEIMIRKFSIKEKIEILKSISHLVTSRIKNIRIMVSKCIKIFFDVDKNLLDKLLTKRVTKDEAHDCLKRSVDSSQEVEDTISFDTNDITGMVVYGLEDDCYEVRYNTILSLYEITNRDNINESIEFFVDTLNDENIKVREIASKLLNDLTHKYKLVIDFEYVKQLSYSLHENNLNIKENIVDTLGNVEFSNLKTLTFVLELIKIYLEDSEILRLLFRIYKNSFKLMLKYFKHNNVRDELRITDRKKFIDVAIAFVLSINCERIKVNKNTRKQFKFILLKMCKETKIDNSNLKNMLRRLLGMLLLNYERYNLNDKKKDLIKDFLEINGYQNLHRSNVLEILDTRKSKFGFHLFFCCLVKHIFKYISKKSNEIFKLNYTFTHVKNINIVEKIIEFLEKRSADCSFVEDLLNDQTLNKIKFIDNEITCPEKIDVKFNQALLFTVGVKNIHANSFLIIENEDKIKAYYPVENDSVTVEILENSSNFILCHLIIQEEEKEFILSRKKVIKIIREQ